MKRIILFSLTIGLLYSADCQKLSNSVIASAGDIAKNSDFYLEWTLGEFATETLASEKGLFTQGFHQPILTFKSFHSPPVKDNQTVSGYQVKIAPNPAKAYVAVYINTLEYDNVILTLFDAAGRKQYTGEAAGKNSYTIIQTGHLFPGVYVLDLRSQNGTFIQSFKILKVY